MQATLFNIFDGKNKNAYSKSFFKWVKKDIKTYPCIFPTPIPPSKGSTVNNLTFQKFVGGGLFRIYVCILF